MKNSLTSAIIKNILLPCIILVIIAWFLRTFIGADYFLKDSANFGWFLGVIGTIYTLITAFIIVQVWGQFNGLSALLGKEAKSLCSIWNFTDYLNDDKASTDMKTAIIKYIDTVITSEKTEASKCIKSVHPSGEIINILKVIDRVKFDDKRDSSIFPSLINSYEELSSVRMERIEAGVTRIPLLLKLLFIILNIFLGLSFVFLGFVNNGLYYFTVIAGAVTLSLAYFMADDLDNPFDGFWNVDFIPLENAKRYILTSKHES
jgi:hypothetical protein